LLGFCQAKLLESITIKTAINMLYDNYNIKVGAILSTIRKLKNIKVQAITEPLEIPLVTYFEIELGEVNITVKQLQKIAKIMGYSALQVMAMVYAYDSYNKDAYEAYTNLVKENTCVEEPHVINLTEPEFNYVMLKVRHRILEKTKVQT
jgi:transcriptional regulator with XRE-family HTH domain